MRYLFWLLTLLAALLVGSFVVSNRQAVDVGLWPLPNDIALPLYLVIGITFVLGLGVGRLTGWMSHRMVRGDRRRYARRIETLEAELARTRVAAEPGRSLVA